VTGINQNRSAGSNFALGQWVEWMRDLSDARDAFAVCVRDVDHCLSVRVVCCQSVTIVFKHLLSRL
jgi:hypothetical protein